MKPSRLVVLTHAHTEAHMKVFIGRSQVSKKCQIFIRQFVLLHQVSFLAADNGQNTLMLITDVGTTMKKSWR